MKPQKKLIHKTLVFAAAMCPFALLIGLTGCQNEQVAGTEPQPQASEDSGEAETASTGPHYEPQRGAAELWAQNCERCHNYRSPTSLSDSEWDVAMLHMRHQARLTAEEYTEILKFLKASN